MTTKEAVMKTAVFPMFPFETVGIESGATADGRGFYQREYALRHVGHRRDGSSRRVRFVYEDIGVYDNGGE